MTSQLIVAVFDSVDTARRAANDFDALSEKNEGFHIENGVVVEKDANGELAVLDAESRPFRGGVIGAIAGGLLGMLAQAADNTLLDGTFVETVAARLVPGSVAVILEAKEDTPFSVDNVVAGFGGKVFRHARVPGHSDIFRRHPVDH